MLLVPGGQRRDGAGLPPGGPADQPVASRHLVDQIPQALPGPTTWIIPTGRIIRTGWIWRAAGGRAG
jgi:hypothetical protein